MHGKPPPRTYGLPSEGRWQPLSSAGVHSGLCQRALYDTATVPTAAQCASQQAASFGLAVPHGLLLFLRGNTTQTCLLARVPVCSLMRALGALTTGEHLILQPSLTRPSRSRMAELRSARVSNSPTLARTREQTAGHRARIGFRKCGQGFSQEAELPCRASYPRYADRRTRLPGSDGDSRPTYFMLNRCLNGVEWAGWLGG